MGETVVIKYNAGNVFSVVCALQRIGVEATVTDDPATISHARRVIFPGVGEASSAMEYLRRHRLDDTIRQLRCPVLGICIGMQLMCSHSQEGDTDCLGIFNVPVLRFDNSSNPSCKIPQMGWNTISLQPGSFIPQECDKQYVYYVHSYYAPLCDNTAAVTRYTLPYSAALQKDNFHATQFHPEKSGSVGETILKNFLKL